MLIYLAYLGEADEHCHEPIGRRWKEVNITHCPGLELGRVEITFLSENDSASILSGDACPKDYTTLQIICVASVLWVPQDTTFLYRDLE